MKNTFYNTLDLRKIEDPFQCHLLVFMRFINRGKANVMLSTGAGLVAITVS